MSSARMYTNQRVWNPTFEVVESRMTSLDMTESDRPAFIAGMEYALDLLSHLHRNTSGLAVAGTTPISVRADEPQPNDTYYKDLTDLVSGTLGDEKTDYTTATLLSEGLRLYWNRHLLQEVGAYLRFNSRNSTLDGIRRQIRASIPSAASRDVKDGWRPSTCDLSGARVVFSDNICRVNTVINCYGGVKIPIRFEVSADD